MSKENYWRGKLNDWENSGLNCKQFCLRSEIKYSNFMAWKKKLSHEVVTQPFVELLVEEPMKFRCGKIDLAVDQSLSIEQLSLLVAVSQQN